MKTAAEACAKWVHVTQRNERILCGTATEADYAELNEWADGKDFVELAAQLREATSATGERTA